MGILYTNNGFLILYNGSIYHKLVKRDGRIEEVFG